MSKGLEELLQTAKERFKEASDEDNDEREKAADDLKFASGDQWPEDIKTARKNNNPPRPCLTLNKIGGTLAIISGEFRQLSPQVKIMPVDSVADPKIAEIMGGLIKHIEYRSNAKEVYNTAYDLVTACGRGAWRYDIVNNEKNPFLKDIVINRIPNIFTVYFDPFCKKLTKEDARYWFITEMMPEEEFKQEYPKATIANWDSTNDDKSWRTAEAVRVAEYWWKEKKEKTYLQVERNGEVIVIPEGEYIAGVDIIKDKIKAEKTEVKWAVITPYEVLNNEIHNWPIPYIPIIFVSGRELNIDGKNSTQGVVRPAKDPQMMYNFWASASAETGALQPKAPYLLTPHMLGQYKTQWDTMGTKNWPYLVFEIDSRSPGMMPRREPPPQISSAMANELARMEQDIMFAMNRFQASLGAQGPERTGKAILARQQQGTTSSYPFIDNFNNAYIYGIKILLELLSYVYDTERIIRIIGKDGNEQQVPINTAQNSDLLKQVNAFPVVPITASQNGVLNDLSHGEYDVRASIGPSYTTQRQESLTMMLEFMQYYPAAFQYVGHLIFGKMDIPDAEEFQKYLEYLLPPDIRPKREGEPPPPPQQPSPEMMLEMQKLQLQMQEQNRKEFETLMNAIANLMRAEAAERGQQATEMFNLIKGIKQDITPQQPQQGEIQNA